MLTLGQRLKIEREKRGMSVKDLEAATSIRSLYLEAIERDDFAVIPGEVYLKGFIRNYAIAMSLDPDEVLEQYRTQAGLAPKAAEVEPLPEQPFAQQRAKPLGAGQVVAVRRRINWRRVVVLGLVLALMGGLVYWLLTNIQSAKKNVQTPSQNVVAIPAATAQSAPLNMRKAQLIQVQLSTTDACWVDVTADGKQLYSGMMNANQKMNWEAKEMLRMKLGNAGAAQVSVNGRLLPPLGKQGEVVERVFSLADA